MIQKLRKNFILITMGSVALVLGIILSLVVSFTYNRSSFYADKVLDVLLENNGSFEDFEYKDIPIIGKDDPGIFGEKTITPETKFETRYISISYEYQTPRVIEKEIKSLSDDKAIEMANDARKNKKNRGYIENYRYLVSEHEDFVLFIDNSRYLQAVRNTLKVSLVCYILALITIFILVFALSSRFILPTVKSYEKQKSFITDASHELKTPLTIISANNELLEIEHGENESTKAINKQVDKMTNMIKNLTALATIDENVKKSNFHIFSISDSLLDVIESFKPSFNNNQRRIEVEIEQNVDFNGNESLIRELFNCLLDNANKYSLTYTRVSLKKNKNNISINIINDANDIVDGNNDKCFERFYRSAEARKIQGSGIGLAIAYEIIEIHKGKIHAIGSNKNKTFEIEIVL